MRTELTLLEKEAVHNLINLRLYPSPHLFLGQVCRLNLGGATVRIERTGSPFHRSHKSLHYIYRIEGAGFELTAYANYDSGCAATALVDVYSVTPEIVDANDAFLGWLKKLLKENRLPTDPLFDDFLLN